MAIAQQHLTLEEFRALPEEEPALEYEDGTVTQKMSPKAHHSAIQYELAARFNQFALPRRLARAFPELRVTFGGVSYVPDISLILWDRIPVDASGTLLQDVIEPPDVVVEILSPGQGVTALVGRCVWYVEQGVKVALLVDPAERTILLFRIDQHPRVLAGEDGIELEDVLPGFQATVKDVFDSLKVR